MIDPTLKYSMNNLDLKKLFVRQTKPKDFAKINEIVMNVYGGVSYSEDILRQQIKVFPEGQFVVEVNRKIVGFCMTMITTEARALQPHTWKDMTDYGAIKKHDPTGNVLYGVDICVDPTYRGYKIGERLYNERLNLCMRLGLRSIFFGARMAGFAKRKAVFGTPEKYLAALITKEVRDPTIGFQMKNGFLPLTLLKNYLSFDKDSEGYAVLMRKDNPQIESLSDSEVSIYVDPIDNVRVCTLNFEQRRLASYQEFEEIINYYAQVASEYSCDFLLFPEFVTMSLLSLENKKMSPEKSMDRLSSYTSKYMKTFKQAAVRFNVNIIGGSHIIKEKDGTRKNTSFVFHRSGKVVKQDKIHPTPSEKKWWGIKGGDVVRVMETDKCKIAVLICYDIEFPELARVAMEQGAKIIFVPYATDTRQGHLRVRICAQARTIENQIYVALSGNIGNLPRVHNMDINYAQSCVLTPSDFPFARDGIAADTDAGVEMVAVADLSISQLIKARNGGTVMNLKDRRKDLYEVVWKK
jgi:predicted amidohydrolase/ribosomal protein S18 acetylase RimI-like enzyme